MFCRKCGEVLLDDDRFCPFCGAKVIDRKREEEYKREDEVVYTNSNKNFFSETLKPNWNIEDFPNTEDAPKKTDDILVDWEKHKLLTPEVLEALTSKAMPEQEDELEQEIEHEQETKTELELGFEFNWEIKESPEVEEGEFVSEEIELELDESELEAEEIKLERQEELKKTTIFERVKPEIKDENDKFYTFSQKNAEFQELLDKEYERIKASRQNVERQIERVELSTELPGFDEILEPRKVELKEEAEETKEEKVKDKVEEKIEETVEDVKEAVDLKPEPKPEPQVEENKEDKEDTNAIKLGDIEVVPEEKRETKKADEDYELEWKQQLPPFEDEKIEKKLSIFVVVLGVIVVVLAISTFALTVEKFSPNSMMGKAVHELLEKGRDFFSREGASTVLNVSQSEEANVETKA